MSSADSSRARVRELLGQYVDRCDWFWERNTDKRQCRKLWRHLQAIEEGFGLGREEAVDEVLRMAEARAPVPPTTVYISGRGGSGSHWLAEMLGDLRPFANAGEVSIPGQLAQEMAAWPLEEQGRLLDCVQLLHAWAGHPFPDGTAAPIRRPEVARMHIVNSNGDTNLLQIKQWEPSCVFIHLIRDPRDQVMAFTYRKPGARANYPIEPLEDFLRLMLIFNRFSLHQVLTAPVAPDLVCRYEDLRRDAAAELRKIVALSGVHVSDDAINAAAVRHGAEARRAGQAPMGNLSRTPTRTWRESATVREKLLMHAGLTEVIDTFGYEPDDCSGAPLLLCPAPADCRVMLPDGTLLGELHVRHDPGGLWVRAGHATGTFTIAAGTVTRLRAPGGWTLGFERLSQLLARSGIASLCLAGNLDVTDEFLQGFSAWEGLVELDLARTRITDSSVAQLERLRQLRHLSVVGTGISQTGLTRLRVALSDCQISAAPLITDEIRGRRLFNEELFVDPPA